MALVSVKIPAALRSLTRNQAEVKLNAGDVAGLIAELEKQYPGIKERLCEETGQLRRFVNIFVNGEDIRFLAGLETKISSGDDISIVPAIAGGGR